MYVVLDSPFGLSAGWIGDFCTLGAAASRVAAGGSRRPPVAASPDGVALLVKQAGGNVCSAN